MILAKVKFYKFLPVEEFTLRRKVETGIVQIHRGLNLYRWRSSVYINNLNFFCPDLRGWTEETWENTWMLGVLKNQVGKTYLSEALF